MRLILTKYDKALLIKLLGERGRALQNKKTRTEEQKELDSIQRVIRQLAFGRDDDQTS